LVTSRAHRGGPRLFRRDGTIEAGEVAGASRGAGDVLVKLLEETGRAATF
jgi:hypothetical protein